MSQLAVESASVTLGRRRILESIALNADGGALIGLVGPNGAGKSTLARAISGLLPLTSGRIVVDGEPIATMPRRKRARFIAYLAQGDEVHWPIAARSVVELGRAPHAGQFGASTAHDAAAVTRAMARTGVTAFVDRDIRRLSGGERARVLLARALAVEAPILIADEPVGALDPHHALAMMALLRDEARSGALVIAVLHDLALATRFCDRLIALNHGRLVADDAPLDVLTPAGLKLYYAVSGHHGSHEEERFVIPWKPLP